MSFIVSCSRSLHTSSVLCIKRKMPNPGKPARAPPTKQLLYTPTHGRWIDPTQVKELLWRRHVYNNAMESIRKIFKAESLLYGGKGYNYTVVENQMEDEFARLLALNEERNAENARIRAEREKKENIEMKQQILKEIEDTLKAEEEQIEFREKEVQEAIKLSADFITRENVKEKILEALEKPIIYDYAIDLEGKKIVGPPAVKYIEEKLAKQKHRLYDRSHSQKMEFVSDS
ncbi:mitochondrial ribosome subunit s26 domain-containing protein [Ditylenchus destructor]|nr:mitochondrial ribosome subunit s26 domain-containing protein [Ditylenchus destructor]